MRQLRHRKDKWLSQGYWRADERTQKPGEFQASVVKRQLHLVGEGVGGTTPEGSLHSSRFELPKPKQLPEVQGVSKANSFPSIPHTMHSL